jgi:hypothetical protein
MVGLLHTIVSSRDCLSHLHHSVVVCFPGEWNVPVAMPHLFSLGWEEGIFFLENREF